MDTFIGRQDDIGFIIEQNNAEKSILIKEIQGERDSLFDMLGYHAGDIENKPLTKLLPHRIQELVSEYVEFDEMGSDVGEVLRRTPRFAMVSKNGEVVDMQMRIQYGITDAHPRFIMVASSTAKHVQACIDSLAKLAAREQKDADLGIPDRASFLEKLAVIQEYVDKTGLKASYAVLRVHGYEEVLRSKGVDASITLLKTALEHMDRTLRGTDVIAYLGHGLIGVGLLKAGAADLKIPFERLQQATEGKVVDLEAQGTWPLVVTVAVHSISRDEQPAAHVEECEKALATMEGGDIRTM